MRVRRFLESDTGFYVSVGLFTILVFAIGLGILAATHPGEIGRFELVTFVVGFFLFMASYFIAIAVYELVPS